MSMRAFRRLGWTGAAVLAVLATACGGGTAAAGAHRPSTGPHRVSSRDPETSAALLRIARTFNDDYARNHDGPVYARWDAASKAVISRAEYLARHRDCPIAEGHVHTWHVTREAGGVWLVRYSIGGVQFTDTWYYVHGRFEFDLLKSNPSAVKLYRLSTAQYTKAVGCNH